jgi:hypothetical protein
VIANANTVVNNGTLSLKKMQNEDPLVLHLEKNGSKVLEDGTISSLTQQTISSFYVFNQFDLRTYT